MLASNRWLFWALLSAAFAALTTIFAKLGLATIHSDIATLIRTGVIAVTLALFLLIRGQWVNPAQFSWQTWLFLILSGLATGASWVCYFRALKLGPAAQVAAVDKASLVLVALFGVIMLQERLSGRHWLGVLLVSAGILLLAAPSSDTR